MNMPRFTAEAALWKKTGHYRTGRRAISLSKQMISAVEPAVMRDPCKDMARLRNVYLTRAIDNERSWEAALGAGAGEAAQLFYTTYQTYLTAYNDAAEVSDAWGC